MGTGVSSNAVSLVSRTIPMISLTTSGPSVSSIRAARGRSLGQNRRAMVSLMIRDRRGVGQVQRTEPRPSTTAMPIVRK